MSKLSEIKRNWTDVQSTYQFRPLTLEVLDVEWLIRQAELIEKIKNLVEDESVTKGESFDEISKILGF